MNITFKSETCRDGWIIVDKDQLKGASANNWHIVEIKLNSDGGVDQISAETFCGEDLKGRVTYLNKHVFKNDPVGRANLRNEMARLQNLKEEFCGRCAAHLYLG